MATSRTGLTPHLNFRRRVLQRDRRAGITECPLCQVKLDYDISRKPESAEPDHIVPITRGGSNHPDNGRTICRRCNQSRGNRDQPRTAAKKPQAIKASSIW